MHSDCYELDLDILAREAGSVIKFEAIPKRAL